MFLSFISLLTPKIRKGTPFFFKFPSLTKGLITIFLNPTESNVSVESKNIFDSVTNPHPWPDEAVKEITSNTFTILEAYMYSKGAETPAAYKEDCNITVFFANKALKDFGFAESAKNGKYSAFKTDSTWSGRFPHGVKAALWVHNRKKAILDATSGFSEMSEREQNARVTAASARAEQEWLARNSRRK